METQDQNRNDSESELAALNQLLASFDAGRIEAAVELRCEILDLIANWQDRHRARFGEIWVEDIGGELEYWLILLRAAGRLDLLQRERLDAAESLFGQTTPMTGT